MHADGLYYQVVNAGISGDTTAGGLARVEALLHRQPVALLVVCLGANDALRGGSLEAMKVNLSQILDRATDAGVETLLIGMRLPPNFGPEYLQAFHDAYVDLARSHKVPFVPFLLDGIAVEPDYFLDDGIHPNREGHRRIADTLYPTVRALLSPP